MTTNSEIEVDTRDEISDFYVALEHMLVTVRADSGSAETVRAAAELLLTSLEVKLATFDKKIADAARVEAGAHVSTAEQNLASHLQPVITAARDAKLTFDANAQALTNRLKLMVTLTVGACTAIALAAILGIGFYVWRWIPQQAEIETQTQVLRDLVNERRAQAFYANKAHVASCTTPNHGAQPCVRVLPGEGSYAAGADVFYVIDETP